MICIFCSKEREGSLEHVFPLAIGGTITTDRVCRECNSILGTRVDAALSDFFPIRMRRAKLDLAGNGGSSPTWHEMFLGEAEIVGDGAGRVRTTFNSQTGKLETHRLYSAETIETETGKKIHRVTIDARDLDKAPKIIQRVRKRHGLPPLSAEDLKVAAADYNEETVQHPLIKKTVNVSFRYLRHAMMKIAYELAFLWLGDEYLDDPLAKILRGAIIDADVTSTDRLAGYVGEVEPAGIFNKHWVPHEDHHIAFSQIVAPAQAVVIAVRIFDLYAAAIVVSNDPARYFRSAADTGKLRFVAIDAANGHSINTSMSEESRRIGAAMSRNHRLPPFPDPLSPP